MRIVEAKSGIWYTESSGELRGNGTAGLAVCGEETDNKYTLGANLKIHKGTKVSLIGYYKEGTSTTYLEFVLNVTDGKVQLDKVDGVARTNLKQVTYTIQVGVVYECQFQLTSTQAICILNGSIIIKEPLPTGYTAGKYGFGHTGTTASDYSTFNLVYLQKSSYYTDLPTIVNLSKAIPPKDVVGAKGTDQDYYDYLDTMIEQASRFIDGETNRPDGAFQDGGTSIIQYFDSQGASPPEDIIEFSEDTDAWVRAAHVFFLKYRPVLSITEAAMNSAGIGETENWTATTKYSWYINGYIVFATGVIAAKGYKNIRITYVTGYLKMPTDIKMACARLVVNLLQKQIADRTATFVSFQRPTAINFGAPEVMTPDVTMILTRYKMMGYGEM